jgi:hypothetical protein
VAAAITHTPTVNNRDLILIIDFSNSLSEPCTLGDDTEDRSQRRGDVFMKFA